MSVEARWAVILSAAFIKWLRGKILHPVTEGDQILLQLVINHPYDFYIYRSGIRKGEPVKGWFPMSKCVTNLYRYVEVCLSANVK